MVIINGDCLEEMRKMPDNSVDSIVTDPPYGLKFMGKKWDVSVPSVEIWKECLRVLKPGGHLLSFAGTRTQHRMACNIEDAGFEIRDMIAWIYGSGFPKSMDVSKAIDREAGAEREVIGETRRTGSQGRCVTVHQEGGDKSGISLITTPASRSAQQWNGWGTALKPALEPITVARKPFPGTVAQNVLAHGTGAINVDGCRVGPGQKVPGGGKSKRGGDYLYGGEIRHDNKNAESHDLGRWPANLIHDGSEEVTELLNASARFFYCAKASKADRDAGCEGMETKQTIGGGGTNDPNGDDVCGKFGSVKSPARNNHPTVKPTELMRYLCRLVTPPNGTVLDPFMGSGSTGKAAALEGFDFIGMDLDPAYCDIARARITAVQ